MWHTFLVVLQKEKEFHFFGIGTKKKPRLWELLHDQDVKSK